ncbi:MAG: hypothetical protein J4F36_12360 [Nitrosopumilaceae archaeon]|nr:hypothetical protein [Nitrosopumilaceae archaeon]
MGPRLPIIIEVNVPDGDIVSPVCKLCLVNDGSSIRIKFRFSSELTNVF